MTGSAPNWALPELFRLSDSDFNGPDFSRLVLVVLRRLDAVFPSRSDLTKCKRISEHETSFGRLWAWLEDQGIVSGALSNCALTLSGKKSFGAALDSLPKLAAELMHNEAGLEGEHATKMLLAIMRNHYETFHLNGERS